MRVCMANRNNRMPAIHVQVLLVFIIPNVTAFGFYNGDVVEGVNVKKFHTNVFGFLFFVFGFRLAVFRFLFFLCREFFEKATAFAFFH